MTGLVKEEILVRQAELGLSIENGNLAFDFLLLDRREFLSAAALAVARPDDSAGGVRASAYPTGSIVTRVYVILCSRF